jgi:hypothetical protein
MADVPHAAGWVIALQAATGSPRCGAKRRDGGSCQQPAMPNGRCRMHGGLSTGPRTEAGRAKARRARWRHGHYSAEARMERRQARAERAQTAALIRFLESLGPDRVEDLVLAGLLDPRFGGSFG